MNLSRDFQSDSFWRIGGFLTLLAAYGLAAALPLSSVPFDLFLIGGAGFYLCVRLHIRGCAYALMLLALAGIFGHLFLEESHFLRLGLEASFACSFFAAALSFESDAERLAGLESQLISRAAAIQNLEDEMGKIRESQIEIQISSSKKIEELQKNYEEIAVEKSSLEILNDVLRKANAAHFDEKKVLENQRLEEQREYAAAHRELAQLQNELSQIKASDLTSENRSLLKELNSARFEKEQTRLINETLVRLHADETIRAKENEERLKEFADQRVEQQSADFQREIQQLTDELSKSAAVRLQMESRLNAWNEKQEIDLQIDREEIQEHLKSAEEKIQELAKIECLYKQLRSQFEEKNRVLHEARCALFKAETELQTRALEKEEHNAFFPELLREEFNRVDEEMALLQAENFELQDLVTYLTKRLPELPISFAANRTPLPAGQPSLEETLREALIPKRKKKAKKALKEDAADLSERLF